MTDIRGRIIDVPAEDLHFVRRLGKAVVALWDELPHAARERLLSQAVHMHDVYQTVQLEQQMEAFITKWKRVE